MASIQVLAMVKMCNIYGHPFTLTCNSLSASLHPVIWRDNLYIYLVSRLDQESTWLRSGVLDMGAHQGEIAILLVTSCYGNWEKLRWCVPFCPSADLTLTSSWFFIGQVVATILHMRMRVLCMRTWETNTPNPNLIVMHKHFILSSWELFCLSSW